MITLAAKEGIKLSGKVLNDLWTYIVFPRIKERYGVRASKAKPGQQG